MIPFAKLTEASTEEWKHLRRKGLGGSDAAVLMGANPYRDEFCVYVDKVCDELPPDQQRESAYWGTQLEPIVADEFAKRAKKTVVPSVFLYQSSAHAFMLATIDRFVLDGRKAIEAVLEIKTTSAYKKRDWQGERPPAYPYAQLQHYLAVTDLDHGWVACLIGGQQYVHFLVQRDDAFITRMINKEFELWRRVQELRPPTPDMTCPDVPEAMARLRRWEETRGLAAPASPQPIRMFGGVAFQSSGIVE